MSVYLNLCVHAWLSIVTISFMVSTSTSILCVSKEGFGKTVRVYMIAFVLTRCILNEYFSVLQTVETQMKCSIMLLNFIIIYNIWKGTKDLQTKEYNIIFK